MVCYVSPAMVTWYGGKPSPVQEQERNTLIRVAHWSLARSCKQLQGQIDSHRPAEHPGNATQGTKFGLPFRPNPKSYNRFANPEAFVL